MPALHSAPLLVSHLIAQNTSSLAVNATTQIKALQVICAWPVSGQYGPGSRFLYYTLVATCVLARKAEWLRNACLAGALIFPAVAAVHGIVLASMHMNDAVDMDVYGAFQFCSIGIVAVPVTVRLSQTYFHNPGRNTIFLWTALMIAGLLSLTVEFFRITTFDCMQNGQLVPVNDTEFPYSDPFTCGRTCSSIKGPFSPIRGGSANNIYVIPQPTILTFGTATFLSAMCCIPPILSLISMWNMILKINWNLRWGGGEEEDLNEPIQGTNGATPRRMKGVNNLVQRLLGVVEVLVFGGVVIALVLLGELNFWSGPVNYQTEPMASVGQWAPIVGTGFAAFGSLYLVLTSEPKSADEIITAARPNSTHHDCSSHHQSGDEDHAAMSTFPQLALNSAGASPLSFHHVERRASSNLDKPQLNTPPSPESRPGLGSEKQSDGPTNDVGGRRKVRGVLMALSDHLGNPAPKTFDDTEFKEGRASEYPVTPSEVLTLGQKYINEREGIWESGSRDRERSRSRTASDAASIRAASPRRTSAATLPSRQTPSDLQTPTSPESPGLPRDRTTSRRWDTLQVPSPEYHGSMPDQNHASSSVISTPANQTLPAIVISPDPGIPSPGQSPSANYPTLAAFNAGPSPSTLASLLPPPPTAESSPFTQSGS
ncbi:hypothetical protein B0T22DRAFT_32808 [Podospora appendiculata]|uniref:Uncharacterized protein n=1 Tax=Podospora appendiculata TaxID=314037 RepID=A0AAE0XGH0_9PEZI|nr:hypothetical protein B0T22DRAFT_32808 [Podospora appendiculata]